MTICQSPSSLTELKEQIKNIKGAELLDLIAFNGYMVKYLIEKDYCVAMQEIPENVAILFSCGYVVNANSRLPSWTKDKNDWQHMSIRRQTRDKKFSWFCMEESNNGTGWQKVAAITHVNPKANCDYALITYENLPPSSNTFLAVYTTKIIQKGERLYLGGPKHAGANLSTNYVMPPGAQM